ncbi:MAG TPA: NAD(P)-dependent oxidoreductase [Tepidisphaeraceae bacterium]|nr:NAD(P)-dependent oxidoreductase [Tepidisphaeraceae bacterium]
MSIQGKTYLVTGGTGFIGRGLVKALLAQGAKVRSLDNDSRGSKKSMGEMASQVELITGDIRDPEVVRKAIGGADCVCHLAYINGTEYFYSKPELVLEVAVKGIMNVVDACISQKVNELCLASSSEVYQTPPTIPTAEDAPLSVPDPLNPRFSYGGGKIISELIALNYGRKHIRRVTVFRPHNVYGPNMGWEHVIPQFVKRLRELANKQPSGTIDFPIQGNGQETRAFCYVDDAADGIVRVLDQGEHLNIYHVGTDVESTIADIATQVARCVNREIKLIPGEILKGSTSRRCPNITKLRKIGYSPRMSLTDGLARTVKWYWENSPVV